MINKKWTFFKVVKIIWVTSGIIFTFWLFYSYQADGVDKKLYQSSGSVNVTITDDFYEFSPINKSKNIFIFYPGAMVESKAYVPLCRKIAEKNIQVFLIKMPFRLAAKGYNKPRELNLFSDSTKTYILSGHSQGAKMAAQYCL